MSATTALAPAPPNQPAKPDEEIASKGLTSDEARARLEKDGPNSMPDISAHPLRNALAKFWAPVPWLLEASIVLELALHKYYEALVIAALLVFNAALAYFQESRAQATLAALKSRLALNACVQRDGVWKTVPAAELVRGDLVKLSLGGVVAADVHLSDGSVQLDQSMLTGESLPIEAGAGVDTYAGALVQRGEATAVVTATGARTKFGRTAELVRTARVESTQQKAVLKIVRNLAIFNSAVILAMGFYAYSHAMPWSEIVPSAQPPGIFENSHFTPVRFSIDIGLLMCSATAPAGPTKSNPSSSDIAAISLFIGFPRLRLNDAKHSGTEHFIPLLVPRPARLCPWSTDTS